MSARDDVLARVGTALAGTDRQPQPVPSDHRRQPASSQTEVVELFLERVTEYRATAERCSHPEVVQRLAAVLDGYDRVVVPDGFVYQVGPAVPDTGLTPVDLDGVDAVVTTASVAVATTGTLVLEHGPGQGKRILSLVPDVHVCVVREDQIVHGVPQAIALLEPDRPQTWVSGPSATSDIELDRVEGVHGPRHLHVVVVGPED